MIQVGEIYATKEGKEVQILRATDIGGPYHAVMGSDGIWRYARPEDAGRVTGSSFDMSDPRNLIIPKCSAKP